MKKLLVSALLLSLSGVATADQLNKTIILDVKQVPAPTMISTSVPAYILGLGFATPISTQPLTIGKHSYSIPVGTNFVIGEYPQERIYTPCLPIGQDAYTLTVDEQGTTVCTPSIF